MSLNRSIQTRFHQSLDQMNHIEEAVFEFLIHFIDAARIIIPISADMYDLADWGIRQLRTIP